MCSSGEILKQKSSLPMLNNLFDTLAKNVDVSFDQTVLLQEILDTQEMFSIVITEESNLELFHGIQNVNHFLEVMLQLQR